MRFLLKNFVVIFIAFVCTHAFADALGQKKNNALLDTLSFSYANFVNGSVVFYLPQSMTIDWRQYAPNKIKSINVNKLMEADIAYIRTGEQFLSSIYLKYSVPVPAELKGKHFYLISDKGVDEMSLVGLTGSAKFSILEEERIAPEPVEYFGEVIATSRLTGSPAEGGFVLASTVPLALSVVQDAGVRNAFAASVEAREIKYAYLKNGKKLMSSSPRNHLAEVDGIYSFKIKGLDVEYLFVNWHPDQACTYGCCGKGYSLFQIDREMRELSSTILGCDV